MGRNRLRVLIATALAGFACAWPAYVYLWHRGDGRALSWRAESVRERYVRSQFDVTRNGEVRVLLALGPRSSSGYAIEIERVEEQRGRVLVVARKRSPRLAEPLRAQVTHPALVVVLPDRDKPVAVDWRSGSR